MASGEIPEKSSINRWILEGTVRPQSPARVRSSRRTRISFWREPTVTWGEAQACHFSAAVRHRREPLGGSRRILQPSNQHLQLSRAAGFFVVEIEQEGILPSDWISWSCRITRRAIRLRALASCGGCWLGSSLTVLLFRCFPSFLLCLSRSSGIYNQQVCVRGISENQGIAMKWQCWFLWRKLWFSKEELWCIGQIWWPDQM